MKLECTTTTLEAQLIMGIRTTAPMGELGKVMEPLFKEVFDHIQENGGEAAGVPLTRFYSPPGATIEFECAIPVASPVEGGGRVLAGELPGGRMATVTHAGPYDTLAEAWEALTEWMESEGLERTGAPWEIYLTAPGTEPDPSKWRTQIFFPVS